MKNLVIHEQYIKEIQFLKDIFEADNEIPEIQSTIDPYNNLYVIVKNELYIISYNKEEDVKKFSIGERECTKVVGLEYCVTMQELYCAYETGDVICIDTSDLSHCKHNVVFQCKAGLQYMKLSSDCEIITMVTKSGILIVTFLDFQIIKETNLYSSDFGTQQFINVGWGKKETQFHGSEGKAAANSKKMQLNPNELDSGRIQVTWQDNGQFFAISFLQPETKTRYFKIFDRESNLLYTNEKTNNISDCLSWKGSESLITTTTKTKNVHYFTYYEKNGLKYKCHPFPFKADEMTITDLFWSPNADILAVICKHTSSRAFLQLWTEHNNHMYLKQSLCFSDENPLLYASWTNKKMGNELVLLSLKEVTICSFNWCINHSKGKTMEDQSVVVVIDGSCLLITAFRKAIIPPPFAHQIIDIEVPVNAIVFAPDETSSINSNTFCAVLCDNSILIFKQKQNTPRIEYEVFKRYNYCLTFSSTGSNVQCNKVPSVMGHFLWLTENIILCSAIVSNVPGNVICTLDLNKIDSGDNSFIEMHQPVRAGKLIQHIVASPNVDEAYIISDSIVYKYSGFVVNPTNISFDETCFQVDVVKSASDSKKHIIIALTHTHRLLLNGHEYSNYVLSYFIHTDFLLFTTLRHCLICVPFNSLEEIKREDFDCLPSINLEDEPTKSAEDVRCIERGAHIIAVIPQASKTILLMPRGNLECIEPRMLIVHIIKHLLNNCDYKKAFDFMKKQRMNFNLIYDHDPELFTQNAEKFVKDIANPAVLSLFLSTLQNEDVTKTIYSNCYNQLNARKKSENNKVGINKMAHICKLLRHIIEKQHNADELIQPLLITLLKSQNEEGLRTALIKIKELASLENSQKPNCLLHISAEKALKYLLNTVDISILYDTALSMYDLELTLFIASKSQRDPKEYIPFLNSLKIMDEDYMKYTIDMHLKHYESALVHIAKDLSKFDKCLHLICSQKLYKQALKLFEEDTTEYKRIAAAFGEYLIQKKMYHEAGIMFYRSNDLEKTLKAFMLAGSWQDSIIMLKKMGIKDGRSADLHVHYQSIVTYLKTNGKHEEAATVLLYYLKNAEEAIIVLCEGRNWKRAMRIAYDVQRPDLIETHIKSGITEHTDFLLSQLNQTKEDFLKYKSRLILLRSRMNVTQGLAFSDIFSYIKLLPSVNTDMLSETTSIADSSTISTKNSETSIKSGKSYRSNKNRRKQERKLLSLKEGSMFEDFGLINALYYIITNTYKNTDEWTQLLQMLMYFELDEIAEKLQNEINSFICSIQESKSEIWNRCAPSSLDELKGKSGYTPSQIYEITTPLRTLEPVIFFPPTADIAYLDVI